MLVKVLGNLRVSLLLSCSHAVLELFIDVGHGEVLAPDLHRRDVSVVVVLVIGRRHDGGSGR